ncbi:uncharacterized protein SCHCODRAFT_02508642 [Schizophyllum commune H4-8]|uniref:Uncharacterized protein n=1 Tax=Schizophyllum commune (strain H4-8 / FGSC 9210) TaxID=578458 RepID=D8QAT3_SCHCM|nr:uncharacterized protein SCHCODRAFT_02508642 [Schizophyllum commune H4-8]KAI5890859.1 hypothetical protein SCHCODRAFT_02508642 [Schizophyllum commune H4-8]
MTSPLEKTGANFPCKGYLSDSTGKESVASWAAGSTQTVTLEGSAIHNGGSCQLSISEDGGSSWKVIKSFMGNCPASAGGVSMSVTIPKDVKSGDVLFAWTWNNNTGNREFYMNCAVVTIQNGGGGLSAYPDLFVAQLSNINSCTIPEGVDVLYPNPGNQVERVEGKLGAPVGNCGSSSGGGGGSPPPATTQAPPPATTQAPPPPATTAPSTGACTEGEVRCDSEKSWSMCGSGYWQSMGAVPGGMVCRNGAIVAARKRAVHNKGRWQHRSL